MPHPAPHLVPTGENLGHHLQAVDSKPLKHEPTSSIEPPIASPSLRWLLEPLETTRRRQLSTRRDPIRRGHASLRSTLGNRLRTRSPRHTERYQVTSRQALSPHAEAPRRASIADDVRDGSWLSCDTVLTQHRQSLAMAWCRVSQFGPPGGFLDARSIRPGILTRARMVRAGCDRSTGVKSEMSAGRARRSDLRRVLFGVLRVPPPHWTRRICQANPALEPTCVKCPRNTGDPSSPAQLRSWGLTLRPVRTGVASGSPCQPSPSSCAPPAPHFRRRTHAAPRRRSLIPPTRRRSGEWRPAG